MLSGLREKADRKMNLIFLSAIFLLPSDSSWKGKHGISRDSEFIA